MSIAARGERLRRRWRHTGAQLARHSRRGLQRRSRADWSLQRFVEFDVSFQEGMRMRSLIMLNAMLIAIGVAFIAVGVLTIRADAVVGYLGAAGGVLLVSGGVVALVKTRKSSPKP